MRNWFGNSQLPSSAMVGFELYPWHSTGVTSPMRPDSASVEEFVWRPVAELGAPVFAFGAPWFPILENLPGLQVVDRLGSGVGESWPRRSEPPYESTVASRSVMVLKSEAGITIIAEKHTAGVGPPRRDEAVRLKEALDRWLR